MARRSKWHGTPSHDSCPGNTKDFYTMHGLQVRYGLFHLESIKSCCAKPTQHSDPLQPAPFAPHVGQPVLRLTKPHWVKNTANLCPAEDSRTYVIRCNLCPAEDSRTYVSWQLKILICRWSSPRSIKVVVHLHPAATIHFSKRSPVWRCGSLKYTTPPGTR